jgi:hypothetical protein
MRAGAAEKQAADGRFVAGPIEDRPHGEKLIERQLAVEDVAAGEAVGCFEILGRDDLDAFDEGGKMGRVSGKSLDDGGAKLLAASVPVPFSQLEWRVLNVGRGRACRRELARDRESWEW